ncbi:hypothetical protein AAFF_G00268620 [Aldrovandia affinis]|uniref:Uncharacterized protein n=1 Tax=Aldrovandia affinis TaxID=143900 RepID=A0AAD7WSW9_9TELE|nr:hypothetical protein AAFF_G00268620 [Aldrovandia affinis]
MRINALSFSRSLSQGWPEMFWMEYKTADVRCGRRRLGVAAMKLPCSFWFILLFGAGGLVLFIHLQEISEMVQQQAPGRIPYPSTEEEISPSVEQLAVREAVTAASPFNRAYRTGAQKSSNRGVIRSDIWIQLRSLFQAMSGINC